MVKVPQIKRIAAKKSARGLRLQMFATEILAGTIGIAYCASNGVALAAYAELYFILVQNLIILALIGVYGDGDGDDARRDGDGCGDAVGPYSLSLTCKLPLVINPPVSPARFLIGRDV